MHRRRFLHGLVGIAAANAIRGSAWAATPPQPHATQHDRGVSFRWQNDVSSKPLGEFIFEDEKVRRPYFKNLRPTFDSRQLTRPFPPEPGDSPDHATMHPGVWLAFGDLNGHDFWRNKARVVLDKKIAAGQLSFSGQLKLRYETEDARPVARETFKYAFRWHEFNHWRLSWDSTFEPIEDRLVFGDQEEMGLGVRMATELTVASGGTIVDSEGRKNEKEIWGQTADWCRYGDKTRGLLLMAHPKNFKRSTFHVRDYGLMVANPFAEQAFRRSKTPARTVIEPGESLRLRFAITGYRGAGFDAAAEYAAYVKASED